MNKLSILILLTVLLGACTDKPVTEEVKAVTTIEDTAVEKTQEEPNAETKELAIKIGMTDALDGNIEDGTLVKSTGTISSLDDGGNFFLNTTEGEHRGHYKIANLNTVELELNAGDTVAVYGLYRGVDEEGFQKIIATIIE